MALIVGTTLVMQWVYVAVADFSWVWKTNHPDMPDEQLNQILAGKGQGWFFLKHFFWWQVLLLVEMVFLVAVAVAVTMMLWPEKMRTAVAAAARSVLWGKACVIFNAMAGMAMLLSMPRPAQRLPSQADPLSWASLLQMSERQPSIMMGQAQGPIVLASVGVMVWMLVASQAMTRMQALVAALACYGSWALLMAWGGPRLIMLFIA